MQIMYWVTRKVLSCTYVKPCRIVLLAVFRPYVVRSVRVPRWCVGHVGVVVTRPINLVLFITLERVMLSTLQPSYRTRNV